MMRHRQAPVVTVLVAAGVVLSSCSNVPPPAAAQSTSTPPPIAAPSTNAPLPTVEVGTGATGDFSIRGIVTDSSGAVVSGVYVTVTVFEEGGGWDVGVVWYGGGVYTDDSGAYAFDHLPRVEAGTYEVWFNGRQEYGRAYENSGYYLFPRDMPGDAYTLNATVYPVSGSAFVGTIQYEDADGTISNYLSSPLGPDHFVALNRGTDTSHEYSIGFEYLTYEGGQVHANGLAGGTYYLSFQHRRSDGTWIEGTSPSFQILPGETTQFDYTFPFQP
jgi:hypothetical protein